MTLSGSMYAMAVSLDEADLAWSTEYVETNIKDLKNGLNNQMAIQALQLGKVSTLLLNGVLIRIKTVQEVGIFRLLQKCRNCLQFE